MSRALVLTYHAIETGDGPLFVDPATFASHLDRIVESGARAVTVSTLVELLRAGTLTRPAVAITFDDGIASVARVAGPLLAERALPATVFCVAGHLGGENDWPTSLPGAARLELARAEELSALVAQGIEIGCHGMTHAPLVSDDEALLRREVVEAGDVLERATGARPLTFAYPYGAGPSPAARRAVETTYRSACSTEPGDVRAGSDLFALPRVDAHYLRRPRRMARELDGRPSSYLRLRRAAARGRRRIRKDYNLDVAGRADR